MKDRVRLPASDGLKSERSGTCLPHREIRSREVDESGNTRAKIWKWKTTGEVPFRRSSINMPSPLADAQWRPRERRPFSSNLRFF